jgi:uncharacterized protein involved in exopolysaccharide biosynthesis
MNLMTMMFSKSLMSDPEIGGTGYMPGMVTPSDIFAYMLKSGAISSIVVEECNLVNYYKKQKYFINNPRKTMYEVNKMLNKSTSIDVSEERFISITVQDKNPAKAAEIANKYGDALDRVYTKLNMTQGRTMREFIEGRLRQEEHLLKSSEDSLNAFQNKYRTVSLDDEMKAVIEMSAQIEAQIVSKKIEFEAMKTYGNEDNPQIKALQNQIAKAEQQLAEIIQGRRDKNIFVPFSKAPDVGMALGRRLRDVKIHQEVYLLLVQQLEQAKILEAKDTPKIQFLERASPPWKKSWPKRMFIVLFGFVIGCLAGILIVLIRNWWEWIMNDPEMSSKYKHIFNLLSN